MIRRSASGTLGVAFATALSPVGTVSAQNYDHGALEPVAALAERVPDDLREAGVIVIGSDTSYAPWEYLSAEDGQTPEGIDVDFAGAMAALLDLEVDFQTSAFDSILPALGTRYDIGVSAFSITNERKKVVNFVSYVVAGADWIVAADNPKGFDPTDYCGSTIAIQTGTIYQTKLESESEACVADGKSAIEFVPFSVQNEATTRVAAGGADATVAGGGSAGYSVSLSRGRLELMEVVEGSLTGKAQVGIAVPKDDVELAELLADTVNHMIEEGIYMDVLDAWGVGSVAIEESLVNPEVDL